MVKLSTSYDNTLKKRIFILKGDEGYTRTTDTLLTVTEFENSYNNIHHMRRGLTLNVLRDIGESNIIVYDNDQEIINIPWSDTPSEITFPEGISWDNEKQLLIWGTEEDEAGFLLDYDIDHEIYAKYMGTKKCLKSESEKFLINVTTPPKYTLNIVLLDDRNQNYVYDSNENSELYLKLTTNQASSAKTVKLYVDGELYNSYDIPLNSNQYINFLHQKEGLLPCRLVFEGDEEYSSNEVSFNISSGLNVSFKNYDPVFIPSQQMQEWNRVTVHVEDYFGNNINNENVQVNVGNNYFNLTSVGNGDYTGIVQVDGTNTSVNMTAYTMNNFESSSDTISVRVLKNPIILAAPSKEVVARDIINKIGIAVDNVHVEGIPILINNETVYTGKDGVATYNYVGNCAGEVNLVPSVKYSEYTGNEVKFLDAIQYWKVDDSFFADYNIIQGNLTNKSYGWTLANNPSIDFLLGEVIDEWELSFDTIHKWNCQGIAILHGINDASAETIMNVSVSANSKVKFVRSDSEISMYVDNKLIKTVSSVGTGSTTRFMFIGDDLHFNNLIMKRL